MTIETDLDLPALKQCYRNYYGEPKSKKVTKSDIGNMLGCLVNADLLDLDFEPSKEDERERKHKINYFPDMD